MTWFWICASLPVMLPSAHGAHPAVLKWPWLSSHCTLQSVYPKAVYPSASWAIQSCFWHSPCLAVCLGPQQHPWALYPSVWGRPCGVASQLAVCVLVSAGIGPHRALLAAWFVARGVVSGSSADAQGGPWAAWAPSWSQAATPDKLSSTTLQPQALASSEPWSLCCDKPRNVLPGGSPLAEHPVFQQQGDVFLLGIREISLFNLWASEKSTSFNSNKSFLSMWAGWIWHFWKE